MLHCRNIKGVPFSKEGMLEVVPLWSKEECRRVRGLELGAEHSRAIFILPVYPDAL